MVQLVGVLSCKPKGCGFDFLSGYMLRLLVWSPVSTYERQLIDVSLSHQCFAPSFSLPSPLSKINRHVPRLVLTKKGNRDPLYSSMTSPQLIIPVSTLFPNKSHSEALEFRIARYLFLKNTFPILNTDLQNFKS